MFYYILFYHTILQTLAQAWPRCQACELITFCRARRLPLTPAAKDAYLLGAARTRLRNYLAVSLNWASFLWVSLKRHTILGCNIGALDFFNVPYSMIRQSGGGCAEIWLLSPEKAPGESIFFCDRIVESLDSCLMSKCP